MFTESASFYDAIYAFKDYDAEAAKIAAAIRRVAPEARTLLDVACGTGMHARRLAAAPGFTVDGLDADPNMVRLARVAHPDGRFVLGDMTDFSLPRRYDVVTCFFGSIGYVLTLDRVRLALACFRRHLQPGGVLLLEPFFQPGALEHGREFRNAGVHAGVAVERVGQVFVDGPVVRVTFDYHFDGPVGGEHRREVHTLGLFTVEEMRAAIEGAGFRADYDPVGLIGRGLWMGLPEGEP
jgi:ubiquinone/menaquinone biosynthesis C-methylase UbiE